MDNFTDRLVEKINAYGARQAQGQPVNIEKAERKEENLDVKGIEIAISSKLEEVSETVRTTGALNVEMITAYQKENENNTLSAVEEIMAAQASSREALVETIGTMQREVSEAIASSIKSDIAEEIHRSQVGLIEKLAQDQDNSRSELVDSMAFIQDKNNGELKQQIAESQQGMQQLAGAVAESQQDVQRLASVITESQQGMQQEIESSLSRLRSVLVQDLSNAMTQSQEALKGELSAPTMSQGELSQEALEEHIHKESVKVYRNVQAAFDEALEKNRNEISNIIEHNNIEISARTTEIVSNNNDKITSAIKQAVQEEMNRMNLSVPSKQPGYTAVMVLSILNLLGIIVALLWMFKII